MKRPNSLACAIGAIVHGLLAFPTRGAQEDRPGWEIESYRRVDAWKFYSPDALRCERTAELTIQFFEEGREVVLVRPTEPQRTATSLDLEGSPEVTHTPIVDRLIRTEDPDGGPIDWKERTIGEFTVVEIRDPRGPFLGRRRFRTVRWVEPPYSPLKVYSELSMVKHVFVRSGEQKFEDDPGEWKTRIEAGCPVRVRDIQVEHLFPDDTPFVDVGQLRIRGAGVDRKPIVEWPSPKHVRIASEAPLAPGERLEYTLWYRFSGKPRSPPHEGASACVRVGVLLVSALFLGPLLLSYMARSRKRRRAEHGPAE